MEDFCRIFDKLVILRFTSQTFKEMSLKSPKNLLEKNCVPTCLGNGAKFNQPKKQITWLRKSFPFFFLQKPGSAWRPSCKRPIEFCGIGRPFQSLCRPQLKAELNLSTVRPFLYLWWKDPLFFYLYRICRLAQTRIWKISHRHSF